MDYYITTNNFSYLFAFKISNIARGGKYVTSMTDEQLKQRHPKLFGGTIPDDFIRVTNEETDEFE